MSFKMSWLPQIGVWGVLPYNYVPESISRVDVLQDHEIELVHPGEEIDILCLNLEEKRIEPENLPVFSNNAPQNSSKALSWDDETMIVKSIDGYQVVGIREQK
jgi:hypothetical protein